MHSPRRTERGGWRLSTVMIALVSGIAAAFLFGPLLTIKWFEGELPFSPFKVEPTAAKAYVTRKVDISDGYTFTWVERKTARRAPALALRVTPLDLVGWGYAAQEKQLGEAGDGPQQLMFYLLLPSMDFPPETPLCSEAERAFAGCRIAQADVILMRDEGGWETHDILLGRRTPQPTDAMPLKDRPQRMLREFWTSREAGGRLRFRGWDCSAEQLAAERRSLGPLPKADAPLAEHMRCFQPQRAWERWMPGRFGYDKQALFTECQPKGTGCHAYFLFHHRFTDVRFLALPPGEEAEPLREELRIRMFLTAWQMLNHLHEEARQPSGAAYYLAEARVQADVCKALARELQSWGLREPPRGGWANPMLPCQRAGAIATRYAREAPQQAEPVLAVLSEVLRPAVGRTGEWERMLEGRMAALAASGRGDSPEMLHLLASFYGDISYSKDSRDFARHGDAMRRGWDLARKYGQQAPQDRDRIHQALVGHYRNAGNRQAVIGLYEELLSDLERDGGAQNARLAQPLRRLAHFYWQEGDFPSLKRAADRLRGVYLSRPENIAAAADNFEERRIEQEVGFDLAFLYRNYAFNQLAQAEVAPLVREVTARMERTLGAANPYLKAARFHQQEIVTGKAAPSGTPIGGGMLPKIW